ncbi:MAG: efflux RND transporter periplasmic adaptor subunit [Chthoniobacter sp.]
MITKYILPLLALVGVGLGILAALQSARTMVPTPMVSEAPTSPYRTFVAGAGLVESNTENIAIGTQLAGIVSKIDVQIGCQVKKGDPLFTIDDRATRATLASQQAVIKVAESQLAQAKYEFAIGKSLVEKHVISSEDAELRRYAADTAAAQLRQAEAQAQATLTDLERLTVRAPVDGQVLQLKIHLGEFAPTGVLQQPLILLGNVAPMSVRVNVDENDAWRVRADALAIGFLRGNKDIHVPLRFVRFEPYVIPKMSLTGESTERVDTRVLQVVYNFERGELPIFVGQQMDIFIDAGQVLKDPVRMGAIKP